MGFQICPYFHTLQILSTSKLDSSKTKGVSPPQMHINGIIHLSTSIQQKSELRSLLRLELQLLEVPSYRPCLSCSRFKLLLYCCEGTNPQYHRYVGAVGFHLNYPQTEYNAPTGSSSCGRSGIKTHVVMGNIH